METIDINYDFRKDINYNGSDVDKYSITLRKYHKILWSKILPNGNSFVLDDSKENIYLYGKINSQEYFLSSDSIVHTYSKWKRTENIIKKIPEKEITIFLDIAYTIGGYIIFPSNKINNLDTLNQERGKNNLICDRFDITLECIRLYYNNETSPLCDTLKRYNNFFELFENFKYYCEYFLLQDLTYENYSKINFFLPFNGFENNPYTKTVDDYYIYMKNSIEFNKNRNYRIAEYVKRAGTSYNKQ
jgi:hypothetical protein